MLPATARVADELLAALWVACQVGVRVDAHEEGKARRLREDGRRVFTRVLRSETAAQGQLLHEISTPNVSLEEV